ATAEQILSNQFAEVILAPSIAPRALKVFARKKNLRVLSTGEWRSKRVPGYVVKQITGGLLVQQDDDKLLHQDELKVVTQNRPDDKQMQDLMFAWRVAKYVKSNAIVYARDGQTLGIGA